MVLDKYNEIVYNLYTVTNKQTNRRKKIMTFTMPLSTWDNEPEWNVQRPEPTAGMAIEGDEWDHALSLIEGDEIDQEVFGTNLRYQRNDDIIPSLPVKITITGRVVHFLPWFGHKRVRVEIQTWIDDDTPAEPFRGWLYLHGWNE